MLPSLYCVPDLLKAEHIRPTGQDRRHTRQRPVNCSAIRRADQAYPLHFLRLILFATGLRWIPERSRPAFLSHQCARGGESPILPNQDFENSR